MNKEDCLNAFKAMSEGMIEKDPLKLKESMSKDSVLYHMTGRKESREGFIKDILNGILNYYDYRIDFFELNNDVANVKIHLKAKVYGGSISWWPLEEEIKFIIEDNKTKIKESRVRLG